MDFGEGIWMSKRCCVWLVLGVSNHRNLVHGCWRSEREKDSLILFFFQ